MMLSKLANQINSQTFPMGKALLAISGGVDSMVLWALLRELDIPYAIAHVNFQLRGQESDQDQELIEREAEELKAELFLRSDSANDYAQEHKLSIQEAAREMRYSWFDELIKKGKADYLVTAHHLDDSLETFFINLNRGTGLKGLGGIVSREKIFRPLLNCPKDELLAYAKEYGVKFRDDSSNQKDDYLRNWFRHHLIPLWKDKNPHLMDRMRENFKRFQESQSIVDHYLSQKLSNYLSDPQLPQEFDLTNLETHPFPEALLRSWLSVYGFNADQVHQVLNWMRSSESGAVFFSTSYRLLCDRNKLILDQIDEQHNHTYQLAAPASLDLNFLQLKVDEVSKEEVDFNSTDIEYFDADKLIFPLEFRPWSAGDRMQPLGMKGQKKISDILINEKIDRFEKERQYVMLSNSEVAWLLGIRMSEAFKVDTLTNKVIRIAWSKL